MSFDELSADDYYSEASQQKRVETITAFLEEAHSRGLRALGLEPLGCRHGNLEPDRFLALLERAIRAAPRRDLERIWLVVP